MQYLTETYNSLIESIMQDTGIPENIFVGIIVAWLITDAIFDLTKHYTKNP